MCNIAVLTLFAIVTLCYETTHKPLIANMCKSIDEPRSRYKNTMARVYKLQKLLGTLANIEALLTMYVARHSWANVAREQRVSLNHKPRYGI